MFYQDSGAVAVREKPIKEMFYWDIPHEINDIPTIYIGLLCCANTVKCTEKTKYNFVKHVFSEQLNIQFSQCNLKKPAETKDYCIQDTFISASFYA